MLLLCIVNPRPETPCSHPCGRLTGGFRRGMGRTDTNVLWSLPLQAKKQVISTVVAQCSDGQSLVTPFHVRWVMESVGHAFALPIDEADLIEKALAVYFGWIFGPQRPPPMREDERPFLAEIFRHFSVLFEPKVKQGTNIVQLGRHAGLCTSVLDALVNLARRHALHAETWEVRSWVSFRPHRLSYRC